MAISRGLTGVRLLAAKYPRQFWLLFSGMLISAAGGSMVWPFLTIIVRQRLEIPLATIGLLLALHSAAALVTTLIAGPIVDRLGRKGVMAFSLFSSALIFLAMSQASSLPAWLVLMAASGALNPLFNVGSDAMVADLLPPEQRAGAYALIRMSNNVGVAIGPAIGGFLATASHQWAFFAAAAASGTFALLLLFFAAETLPARRGEQAGTASRKGYGHLLRDGRFLAFCAISTLAVVPPALVFVLLPVYAKEQHGVVESQYGFVMAANAAMVVLFQYTITRRTARYAPLLVMAAGALFYALGVGSVALGTAFLHYLLSMVVLTIGEMLLVPTGTTLAANLSPSDMRGRYMGFYGLTWRVGFGLGPVTGGILSDHLGPAAIWYGGLLAGLAAAAGYLLLAASAGRAGPNPETGSQASR